MDTTPAEVHSHSVLCWGNPSNGELGWEGSEEQLLTSPVEIPFFAGQEVKTIGCADSHTLFVMKDGSLFSSGNNDYGQLGHNNSRIKPGG